MTSKELVLQTLEFRNTSGRAPHELWSLPWAEDYYPQQFHEIKERFTWDFSGPQTEYKETSKVMQGRIGDIGLYVDEWGCMFDNIQKGVFGEPKQPLVALDDEDWNDTSRIVFPEEQLSFDIAQVNRSCAERSDKFLWSPCLARPFERLQFIRTSEALFVDLMEKPKKMMEFIEKMHDFDCRLFEKWAQTDVDALQFMDDWGSQTALLINPELWREIFKPLYQDYIDIAHKHGKKIAMHSDGHTLSIIPDLIDMGLDMFNTQIFCIGIENLAQFKGKITFWGEICRQHLLPHGTLEDIDNAVKSVYETLWQDGGCIAQCEFGPGAKPENVAEVFVAWDRLTANRG